jgi:hypothetical protein
VEILSKSKRVAAAAFASVCLALFPGLGAASDGESLEYAVKANYLYKFGAYVEWPSTAFSLPTSPIKLCIVGEDPFGARLDQAVAGQRINGRSILVQRLKTIQSDAACHILYFGYANPHRANQPLDALRGSGMLTVSDTGELGASISFVVKDNRVRFDIDEDVATQNGLVISSKLLSLALTVKQRQIK